MDRHGAEKNELGFRFRVQQDSYHGMSAIRLGSRNEVALGAKTGMVRVDDISVEFIVQYRLFLNSLGR